MDPARVAAKERGGGPASVSNVLSVSGTGGIKFRGGDLGFVSGDVQESVRVVHGISQTGYGS